MNIGTENINPIPSRVFRCVVCASETETSNCPPKPSAPSMGLWLSAGCEIVTLTLISQLCLCCDDRCFDLGCVPVRIVSNGRWNDATTTVSACVDYDCGFGCGVSDASTTIDGLANAIDSAIHCAWRLTMSANDAMLTPISSIFYLLTMSDCDACASVSQLAVGDHVNDLQSKLKK